MEGLVRSLREAEAPDQPDQERGGAGGRAIVPRAFGSSGGPRQDCETPGVTEAIDKMKARVRELTARSNGRSLAHVIVELRRYLLGWQAYFRLAETPSVFADVDRWIRRRLRALIIYQCRHGRRLFRVLARARCSARARRGGRRALSSLLGDGGPHRRQRCLPRAVLRHAWSSASGSCVTSTL